MWIAVIDFYFRGKLWKKGDTVPAEGWPGRTALVRLRRIRFVSADVIDPEPVDINKLKRDDLNDHAASLGIDDPASHKSKEALIAAINDHIASQNPVAPSEPPVDNGNDSTPSDSTEDESEEESTADDEVEKAPVTTPIVADNLFADPAKG